MNRETDFEGFSEERRKTSGPKVIEVRHEGDGRGWYVIAAPGVERSFVQRGEAMVYACAPELGATEVRVYDEKGGLEETRWLRVHP